MQKRWYNRWRTPWSLVCRHLWTRPKSAIWTNNLLLRLNHQFKPLHPFQVILLHRLEFHHAKCFNPICKFSSRWFSSSAFWPPSPWLTASTFFRAFASSKPAWWCWQSSTVSDLIQSWSQFWKGAQIFNTCRGTTLHSHNLFSRQFFQPYIRFTHIQNINPSSTWALQCITPLIENTADLANTSNSPTRDWSKPNWPCATGMNMTICIFGLRSPSLPTEWTTAVLK